MTGPKIIGQLPVDPPRKPQRDTRSGVRIVGRKFIAVRNGRLAGEFTGNRAFLAASRAAGSSERLV